MSEEEKPLSPFDFVNAIHLGKNLVVDDLTEKQYVPYLVNKALSFGADTIIQSNEMNCRAHLSKKAQSIFLAGMVTPKKRFNKWINRPKIGNIEAVMEYYQFSYKKAIEALKLLPEQQLAHIEKALFKGGIAPSRTTKNDK